MADSLTSEQTDDAPLTSSKDGDRARIASEQLVEPKGDSLTGVTVTINRPRKELFSYFRDLANLPSFMDNVIAVDPIDAQQSRWRVKAPAGKAVEWVSQITEERENELIAWASVEGADVPNSGRIDFRDAPGGRGTWVTATILYDPPGGIIGKIIAKMFQREPTIQARRDLRRFKQLMETGEIATAARTRKQLDEEMD